MKTPTRFKRPPALALAAILALTASATVAAISFSAELLTAELDGTANKVTVEQGKTAPFTISLTASGNVACGSTSTAKVDTSYSVASTGTVSSNTPSEANNFSASSPCNGENAPITWAGAPKAQTVSASVSAAADAPLGERTVTLNETGTTSDSVDITNSNQQGGKLEDKNATTLTIEVVAPAAPANAAPTVPGAPALSSGSNPNNTGVFGLGWDASTDDGKPVGSSMAYQLQHADFNDAAYTDVTGATALTTNSFTFGAPGEDEGTWTYKVRASDGTAQSAYSGASSAIKVDKSSPTNPTASTTPASAVYQDWFKDTVTVSYSGSTDPDLQDGSNGSGVSGYTAPQVFNTTSSSHGYSGKATDNAGNQSAAASGTVKVDASTPTVDITCPTDPVIVGSSGWAGWTASDTGSGFATASSGSVPLVTNSVGTKTASVPAGTVKDNVGHESAAVSCNYSVVYDFAGFFQPIDMGGVLNKAKAGSAIPVKFSLDGTPQPGSNTPGDAGETTVMTARSVAIKCPSATSDPIEQVLDANSTSGLKYDAAADQWMYVWKTTTALANSCQELQVTLADTKVKIALFQFTK